MTGQVGTWALGAGLTATVAATLLWLHLALHPGTPARAARLATGAGLLCAAVACGALEWALLGHDFGIRFVAENGSRHLGPYHTVTSLWSALDGSLLLWLLILTGYASLLGRLGRHDGPRLHHWAMTLVSVVGVFFFALSHFAANPFHPVHPVPSNGPGPNPLLQAHPAMGLHPPLLYAGYVGLVVPFAYALAGLLAGQPTRTWLRAARRWTLFAWACLTAGIALGAWWSYAVLGWGGYWAWDPVENASLLPWLTATAFLHSVLDRRAARAGWPVALACASFLLVLVGTFLTRSGLVASVHAFTESALGPMLLIFLLLAGVGTAVLIGWRRTPDPHPPEPAPPLSRPTALLGNRILLTTVTTVVLVGTVVPPIAQALSGTGTAVGPAYFNRTAVPLAIAVLALMGLAVLLPSTGTRPAETARRAVTPAAVGLAVVAVTGLAGRPGPMALAAFGCAGFTLTATAAALAGRIRAGGTFRTARLWSAVGGSVAHAGVALVAVGVAASSAYTVVAERELPIGQTLAVPGATIRLAAIDRVRTEGGMTVRARLTIESSAAPETTLTPALTYHPAHDTTVSVPAIRTGLLRDTYTTLLAVSADGRTGTIRLAANPMVSLIWAGAVLTALGGLLALGSAALTSGGRGRPGRPGRPTAGTARPVPATASGAAH